jgi:hypothetical protein
MYRALKPRKHPVLDKGNPTSTAQREKECLDERLLGEWAEGAVLQLINAVQQDLQLLREMNVLRALSRRRWACRQ